MAKYVSLLIIMLCINMALVFGGVLNVTTPQNQGGLLGAFFSFTGNEPSDIKEDFSNEVKDISSKGTLTSTSLSGFFDFGTALKSLFSFIINTLTAPLQLLFNPNLELPYMVRMMMGLPLTLLWIFSLISLFRGNE